MTAIHIHPDSTSDVMATQHAGELAVTVRAQWKSAILRLHFCSLQEAASFASCILDALDELQKEQARPAEPVGAFVARQEF